jgi:FlaA1/EpsC-like NDP-sugar epimerase
MLDTNLVRHARFKRWLSQHGHGSVYFAVSTDKAANPTSLMGASKRLMEDVAFGLHTARAQSTTAARFANVAFSNGSLLEGFLHRLATNQPLAAPRDTRRYFISKTEAAELCLIVAMSVPDQHIGFPNLDPESELQTLESIAVRVLEHFGLVPQFYDDEERARREVASAVRAGRWPIVLTPLDTSGEKPYEEFVADREVAVDIGLKTIRALHHSPSMAIEQDLFDWMAHLIDQPGHAIAKGQIIEAIQRALLTFGHVDSDRNLDQRL